jgi:hypothetical protein
MSCGDILKNSTSSSCKFWLNFACNNDVNSSFSHDRLSNDHLIFNIISIKDRKLPSNCLYNKLLRSQIRNN